MKVSRRVPVTLGRLALLVLFGGVAMFFFGCGGGGGGGGAGVGPSPADQALVAEQVRAALKVMASGNGAGLFSTAT
jgi:hypothetical protein